MKIVVTCGPSYAPIDGARRITNFSTGALGTRLANALTADGWETICLKGEGATCAETIQGARLERFGTNEDLALKLRAIQPAGEVGCVFHAAALCDFEVERIAAFSGETVVDRKISTRSGNVTLHLKPSIKILPELRAWFPNARIAGWKYELNGGRAEALAAGGRQMAEAGTSICVVNGAAYGEGFAICSRLRGPQHCATREELIGALLAWLKEA